MSCCARGREEVEESETVGERAGGGGGDKVCAREKRGEADCEEAGPRLRERMGGRVGAINVGMLNVPRGREELAEGE